MIYFIVLSLIPIPVNPSLMTFKNFKLLIASRILQAPVSSIKFPLKDKHNSSDSLHCSIILDT